MNERKHPVILAFSVNEGKRLGERILVFYHALGHQELSNMPVLLRIERVEILHSTKRHVVAGMVQNGPLTYGKRVERLRGLCSSG